MQSVVDGRQRHALAGSHGLLVQHFRGDMPVAAAEQQHGKRDTLARRPQAGPPQKLRNVDRRGGNFSRTVHRDLLRH